MGTKAREMKTLVVTVPYLIKIVLKGTDVLEVVVCLKNDGKQGVGDVQEPRLVKIASF